MPTLLPPTRWERILRAGAYGATGAIGLSVLLQPPVLGILGNVLTAIWAVLIMTALPCIPATLKAKYRAEYILLPLFTGALIVSVLALWVEFSYGLFVYAPLPRLFAATALSLMFCARWINLHRIVESMGGKSWTRSSSRRSRH